MEDRFNSCQKDREKCGSTVFLEPTSEIIAAALSLESEAAPRLLVGDSDFDKLKSQAETDTTLSSYKDAVISKADTALTATEPTVINTDTAGAVNSNITNLAAAYKFTGRSDYLNKAKSLMLAVANISDWNHVGHFLDTASVMDGMSYGYAWLYNDLDPTTKNTIASAIYNKGILKAKAQHDKYDSDGGTVSNFNWTGNKTNWNFVCNSAAIKAALAIGHIDEYKSVCADMIVRALKSMEPTVDLLGADGGWYEGPLYAQMGVGEYMTALEAMRTRLGTEYGYASDAGLLGYNNFIVYSQGARAAFNFSDGGEDYVASSTLGLASKITGNDFYGAYRTKQISNRITTDSDTGERVIPASFVDMLWYKPTFNTYDLSKDVKGMRFDSIDTATFRNGFFGYAGFAGLHGGENNFGHAHLDSGSFVYDYNGVRFATDLGQDDKNYNANGYFTTNENSAQNRWQFYRTRAESHNTIVINPDNGPDQVVNSVSDLTAFKTADKYGYAILDTSAAYAENATSTKRGLYYWRDTGAMLVQDEITLKGTSNDVYWHMTFGEGASGASMEVAPDGKSAILTREGHRVWVGLLSGNGTFTKADCKPFEKLTASSVTESDNGWFKKLRLSIENVDGNQKIAVYICPLSAGQNAPASYPTITDLSAWN